MRAMAWPVRMLPARSLPDGDLADVGAVFQVGHQQLRGAIQVHQRRRQEVEDRVEERLQRRRQRVGFKAGDAVQGNRVDHWELGLFFAGAQVDEEIKGGVDHIVGPRRGAVDLVDDDDGLQPLLQRLAQHKARLRHGAFHRIHQEQHAIDHVHDALHLAAEVGMARRIDDVDRHILVLDAGVLGENGDAALPLQVVGVHDALHHGLILPKDLGLAQHPIDQGGFAVIDVGDDGNVANIVARR
jgi:hypothetical protein